MLAQARWLVFSLLLLPALAVAQTTVPAMHQRGWGISAFGVVAVAIALWMLATRHRGRRTLM